MGVVMNFDLGEVLSHAWQITWKHKVLWVIAILLGLLTALMFPLMFSPVLLPVLMQDSRTDLALLFIIGFIIVFLLFMLVMYLVSALAQTAITLGILNVEQNGERLSASELIKRSLSFFWRVLGVMLLFAVGMMLIMTVTQVVILLLTIMTFGFGAFLSILIYPVIYIAMIWMEQSMNAVIIDKMTISEAVRQGWNLIRNNLMPIIIIALIIYFGVGMLMGIVMVPMMIPFFALPFSFMSHEVNWIVVLVSIACAVIVIPLFAILTGGTMIFTKSVWVLTYLRLTRSPKPPTLSQAAS